MDNKDVKKNEGISPILSNKDKLAEAKKNNADIKNKMKSKKKKLYVISIIGTLIIIVIAIFLAIYLNTIKYKSYIKYEEKMKTYGFDKMYNNKTAKTSEPVTKAEALKLALGAVFNTSDISGFAAQHNEYENAIWVEYAKAKEITKEDININNYNKGASYIDVITYFESCKIKFLKDEPIKDTDVSLRDIAKYNLEQQTAIKDMLANEIINLSSKSLRGNETIFKGQLNEIVVNFVEKYNTITMNGDKININPDKIPANAELYPYTITTVDKEVYEKPFTYEFTPDASTAKELYAYQKDIYPQIQSYSEEFFSNILNIDYKTITEESFTKKITPYLIVKPTETFIKNYVKHVIDNEIIIEGKAKLQVPAIYSDGSTYRARIKLTFEIKQSKTKDNLLYLDFASVLKKTYEKTKYDLLVDYYLEAGLGSRNLYVSEDELYNTIIDKDKCGITREVYIPEPVELEAR